MKILLTCANTLKNIHMVAIDIDSRNQFNIWICFFDLGGKMFIIIMLIFKDRLPFGTDYQ